MNWVPSTSGCLGVPHIFPSEKEVEFRVRVKYRPLGCVSGVNVHFAPFLTLLPTLISLTTFFLRVVIVLCWSMSLAKVFSSFPGGVFEDAITVLIKMGRERV